VPRIGRDLNLALLLRAFAAALLLSGVWSVSSAQTPPTNPASARSAPTELAVKSFDLKLVEGKLIDRPDTLRVKQGDTVQLRWISDLAMSLHLHGYDIAIAVQRDVPTVTSFAARLPGRFPVSDHSAGAARERTLLYLEVLP